MKRLLSGVVGVIVLCVSVDALAQGAGSPSNPLYTRDAQGNWLVQVSVVCGTDTALLTATDTDNVLSIYCQNMETTSTNRIGICPRAAAAGACDNVSKYMARVDGNAGFTIDKSSGPRAYSCNGSNYRLNCTVESWYKMSPNQPTPAVPTPIPSPTPTPTP